MFLLTYMPKFVLAGVQHYLPDSQSMPHECQSVSPKMLKMRLFRSHHTSFTRNRVEPLRWFCLQPTIFPFRLASVIGDLTCLPLGTRRKETSFLRLIPSRPCSFWFWHQQSHSPWWLVPESLFQPQQGRKTSLRPPNCANDEYLEISGDGPLIQSISLNFRLNQCFFQPTLIFIKHST